MHKPTNLGMFATWGQAFAPSPELAAQSDQEYFTDPRHTFWRSAMDHREHSRGHEWAFRGDVAYNFLDDGGFLKQLKFGARYSDREQNIRYSTYNWGNLSEVWGSAVFMDQVGVPDGNATLYSFKMDKARTAAVKFHVAFRRAGDAVILQAARLMLCRVRRSVHSDRRLTTQKIAVHLLDFKIPPGNIAQSAARGRTARPCRQGIQSA